MQAQAAKRKCVYKKAVGDISEDPVNCVERNEITSWTARNFNNT